MKKIIVISILILLVFLAHSQKKYSLEECVNIALNSNRNIKQAELILLETEIGLKEARNKLLPQVNAEANHNWNLVSEKTATNTNTFYWGLNSSIQVFDGLKSIYEIKYRKNELAISDLELLYQKQIIRDQVTNVYLKILLNEELKAVALSQLQLTDSLLIQRKVLATQGRIAQGELLELQTQRAKEEFQYTHATNNLIMSILDLTQLLEIEYDSMFTIGSLEDNFISKELSNSDSVYNNALKNRANIRSAELQVHANKLNTALIKSRYFPNVSAGIVAGESYLNGSNNPFSTRVFITASVPIFDKFETKTLLQKNKAQTKLAELNLTNQKKELYKAIEQFKYYSIAAKAKWESAVKSEKISIEAYNYLKNKFESGKATVYELYQAKTDLVLQNSAALQAKYEYYFQQKMIQNLMN